jgi:hypothetical protein
MNYINSLAGSLIKWVEWLLEFARKYANYLALGALMVMASKMFKFNLKVGGK